MTPPVLLRTAYGAEVTVTPEPGLGHVQHRHYSVAGEFGERRRWVLRLVGYFENHETTLSHADLVSLSAQLAALVEAER